MSLRQPIRQHERPAGALRLQRVSVVVTVEDNTRFAQAHGADYPILSEVTRQTGSRHGELGATGAARRWAFCIGLDGTILHVDNAVKGASAGPDMVAKPAE